MPAMPVFSITLMLGSMIPIPVVGTILGGIVGGIIGEKLFGSIARLFGYKKKAAVSKTELLNEPQPVYLSNYQAADQMTMPAKISLPQRPANADPYGVRLPETVDRIPYSKMHPNLKKVKDAYEASYKAYVSAISSGNQTLAKQKLEEFQKQKARYQRALGAYIK